MFKVAIYYLFILQIRSRRHERVRSKVPRVRKDVQRPWLLKQSLENTQGP